MVATTLIGFDSCKMLVFWLFSLACGPVTKSIRAYSFNYTALPSARSSHKPQGDEFSGGRQA